MLKAFPHLNSACNPESTVYLSVRTDKFYDLIVVLRPVRECAVRADFDSSAFLLVRARIARAVLEMVQRAVAEETVHLLDAFVAWVVFAVSVLEIFMRVLHDPALPF